jgi:putative colanic acid biosynthesis acetyltransferase WcaF
MNEIEKNCKNGKMPNLHQYTVGDFSRGRPKFIIALWMILQPLLLTSWLPGSWHRRFLLYVFGAQIGAGVIIKPGVRVKFPWRLKVGAHTWVGEGVWIDNLADVEIGDNCCISQDAYLCTGSHDWSRTSFDLICRPILVEDGAWVAARAAVAPGVTIGEGAVLAFGSVATTDLVPWSIYAGNPATLLRARKGAVK